MSGQLGCTPPPAVCAPLPLTAVALPRLCTCFHFFCAGSIWHPRVPAEASSLPPSTSWTRQKKKQQTKHKRTKRTQQLEEPRSSEALTFDPSHPVCPPRFLAQPPLPTLLSSSPPPSVNLFGCAPDHSKSQPTTIRPLFEYKVE